MICLTYSGILHINAETAPILMGEKDAKSSGFGHICDYVVLEQLYDTWLTSIRHDHEI